MGTNQEMYLSSSGMVMSDLCRAGRYECGRKAGRKHQTVTYSSNSSLPHQWDAESPYSLIVDWLPWEQTHSFFYDIRLPYAEWVFYAVVAAATFSRLRILYAVFTVYIVNNDMYYY